MAEKKKADHDAKMSAAAIKKAEEDKKAVQAEKDSGQRAEIVKGIISKLAMEVMTKKS